MICGIAQFNVAVFEYVCFSLCRAVICGHRKIFLLNTQLSFSAKSKNSNIQYCHIAHVLSMHERSWITIFFPLVGARIQMRSLSDTTIVSRSAKTGRSPKQCSDDLRGSVKYEKLYISRRSSGLRTDDSHRTYRFSLRKPHCRTQSAACYFANTETALLMGLSVMLFTALIM